MAENNKASTSTLADEVLVNKIYVFRDQKVMLDSNLAELYGVETSVLNQALSRNMDRFPKQFMFELTSEELQILWAQTGTL